MPHDIAVRKVLFAERALRTFLSGFKFRNEFFWVFLEIFYAAFATEFYSYPFVFDDYRFAHAPKFFSTHNAHIQWIIVYNSGYFLVFTIAMFVTVVFVTVVVMIMIVVTTTADEKAGSNKSSGNELGQEIDLHAHMLTKYS